MNKNSMKKEQKEFLKTSKEVDSFEEGMSERLEELFGDDPLGWFQNNCKEERSVLSSPGLDIDMFIFDIDGEKIVVTFTY